MIRSTRIYDSFSIDDCYMATLIFLQLLHQCLANHLVKRPYAIVRPRFMCDWDLPSEIVLLLSQDVHDSTVRSISRCRNATSEEVGVLASIVMVCLNTDRTASLLSRMNTFHSFSSPMVVRPVVILFCWTMSASLAKALFSGSMDLPKARLLFVYS